MYILFKRHGHKRYFKRYSSFEKLTEEIKKGHNADFPGNNQFYYNTETKEIEVLNPRLSMLTCEEYLESSQVVPSKLSA
jgi:hypothetical protein